MPNVNPHRHGLLSTFGLGLAVCLLVGLATGDARAQQAVPASAGNAAPLVLYFDIGNESVRPQDYAVLNRAARLFSDAKPVLMIITGGTDAVGPPAFNLDLSQRRATVVFRALVARGLRADAVQIVAKGQTEPAIPTPVGVPEPRNRRVELTWR